MSLAETPDCAKVLYVTVNRLPIQPTTYYYSIPSDIRTGYDVSQTLGRIPFDFVQARSRYEHALSGR